MTAITEPRVSESSPEYRQLRRRIRGLVIAVVVLAVALVGLGTWMIYGYVSESDAAATGEIRALVDDYIAAWNEPNGEAFLALTTDNYSLEYGGVVERAESIARDLSSIEPGDFVFEARGEPLMSGDGPLYFVAQAGYLTERGFSPQNVINVYTVVETDGEFLISHHQGFFESTG